MAAKYNRDPIVLDGAKILAGIKRPWAIYTGYVSAPNLLIHNCLLGVKASMTNPSNAATI
ncbi:MAG: hypothetical protein WAO80_06075 [Caldicoprobacterales bacterium]